MIKYIYIIALALTLFSCEEEEEPVNYTLLSGQVVAAKADEIELYGIYDSKRYQIPIEQDGSFSDTLRLHPGTYLFTCGNIFNRIYLDSGDDLHISFHADNFRESLAYSGKGAEINNYLNVKLENQRKFMGDGKEFELDRTAYQDRALQIKKALQKTADSFPGLPEKFRSRELRNLHYQYLNSLDRYVRRSPLVEEAHKSDAEEVYPELAEIKADNLEDFKFSGDYRQLITTNASTKAEILAQKDSLYKDIAYLKIIREIQNNSIRNHLLYEEAVNGITYTRDFETYYEIFMEGSTDKNHEEMITGKYATLKKVSQGQPSPAFKDYENYAGGSTSLDNLKGKYLYIDVWATWCAPCRVEIPHLKELEKEYQGRNIEFVSISIDKNEDRQKWRAMIEEEGMGGVQLLADKEWDSTFVQDYMITGIPRFILLDPEGKIVDPNAPNPSSPEIYQLFESINL